MVNEDAALLDRHVTQVTLASLSIRRLQAAKAVGSGAGGGTRSTFPINAS